MSGIKSALMFGLSGLLFKTAVEKGYIKLDDFFDKTDKEIIVKLEKYKYLDREIKKYFDYLKLKVENFENNPNNYIVNAINTCCI